MHNDDGNPFVIQQVYKQKDVLESILWFRTIN